MKNTSIIFIVFLFSIVTNAQNKTISIEDYTIKVILTKSMLNSELCNTSNQKKTAVILEFDVINLDDKKIFGSKIYAMTICYDYPGEGLFDGKECDLKISELKYYPWDISIINEKLLDKNINQKKFWITDLSRKITIYCEPRKR